MGAFCDCALRPKAAFPNIDTVNERGNLRPEQIEEYNRHYNRAQTYLEPMMRLHGRASVKPSFFNRRTLRRAIDDLIGAFKSL